ncbi:regulatory protein RecX [Pseudothermotoga sp.]|nr:RecX family transcriptional regulator [Pseudothermotoga sp.]MCX7812622.1 RecX family transcriptional regulator [Pseudothermotoga sp.]MDW8138902.1 RecX family transcriptional regulator [Pseudothermotoga sp.]
MRIAEALKYAKRLLRFRMRSKVELRERLLMKGFDLETVETVIVELEKLGYLDDEKFAYLYASDMLAVHGYGPLRIRVKLRQLKVDSDIIDRVIERVLRETDLKDILKKIVERKKLEGVEVKEYLFRRGFTQREIDLLEEGGVET